MACRAGFRVPIYGFDNQKGGLYEGKIEQPRDFIPFGDKRTDEMVALSLTDWQAVRVQCKIEN
jgi:DNA/RNA endonuclease YhcR with UshA esterase domain